MTLLRRYLYLTTVACFGTFAYAQNGAESINAIMPEKHFDILEKYCLDCHDAAIEKGEVNLEDLSFDLGTDLQTAETWQKVLNSLNTGEMPPEDKDQLTDEEKTVLLDDLSNHLVTARKILSDNGGEVTLRRLNRREYANTLEELIGVRPDITNLPDDQANAKFDTLGASLFFSSDQLEQYLNTARRTLELATLAQKTPEPGITRIEPEKEYNPHYLKVAGDLLDRAQRYYAWELAGGTDDVAKAHGFLDGWQAGRQLNSFHEYYPQVSKYLAAPENKTGAAFMLTIKEGFTQIKLPVLQWNQSGKYIIRVRASAYEDDPDRFRYLEFTRKVDQNAERLGWRKVSGSLRKPQVIEFEIDHPPGLKANYMVHKRTHEDRGDKNLWTEFRKENGYGTPWGIWVDWVEIEGPIAPGIEPGRYENVYFDKPADQSAPDYARDVIRRFAERAFRGETPSPEFLDHLYSRYDEAVAEGANLKQALIDPLSIILSSPSFLYMVESTGNEDSELLTGTELAVRLAFFLWSAPPDDELLSLGKSGKLSQPEMLTAQTQRLLSDPRSERFVESFVHQWLEMHRLGMFAFSGRQFPYFDNAVRDSARDEIFQMVRTLMDEKLPLRNLLKSDYLVINDVLADYYEIEGVTGHEFRKVPVPKGSPRGGLLGTVAFAAMGSDGQRSSPVERGAWVLRHLLNNPPPPAPPNVPQLSRLEGEVLGVRELQKAHQEEAQCAQCHRKIDPIGYGLENFDAAGLWRDMEIVKSGKKNKQQTSFEIDPSGKLSNGTTFDDYYQLRDRIADEVDNFAYGLTEALITYGLGRPFGFTDHTLAEEIVVKTKPGGYQFNEFIHALVQSKPFQTK
ncbi:MAG: DUF1592 domain-containing protein [Verrucomicrobiales bacterium]|nr:DUF1592 domain-containing protein [Verrucomicrobiales bacterium]